MLFKENSLTDALEADARGTLTLDDIDAALAEVFDQRLRLDRTVKATGLDGEEGALAAKALVKEYDERAKALKAHREDVEADELIHLWDQGGEDYGAADDEGNIAITQTMDGVVEWWREKQAQLRGELEAHMQEEIARLRAEGHVIDHNVRDKMYDTLWKEEVIEQWEPLEF